MSDSLNQMTQDATELVTTLENPVTALEVRNLQDSYNAVDDMRNEVLGFFKNRIASISRAERIKELMYEQLEVDITSGGLSFDQKMTLLMRLDRDNNDAADSIISMFRPSGNNGESLLTDIIRPNSEKSDLAKAMENYSSEDLQAINELFKAARDVAENNGGGTVSLEMPDGKIVPIAEV